MKTSEAIRAGIKLTKGQAKWIYYMKSFDTCCALGAAIIGSSCDETSDADRKKNVVEEYSQPGGGVNDVRFVGIIESLGRYYHAYGTDLMSDNDEQGLSREQIADRLEKIGE